MLTGKDRGKSGEVIRALPKEGKVIVDGVNVAKKHQRATRATMQGGIIDKDMPIPVVNGRHRQPRRRQADPRRLPLRRPAASRSASASARERTSDGRLAPPSARASSSATTPRSAPSSRTRSASATSWRSRASRRSSSTWASARPPSSRRCSRAPSATSRIITGQKPLVTKAKKSIAGFKLREGNAIGAKVTLRGDRMWEFLDRLVSLAIPRIRDFRGLTANAFDGRGNYTFGVTEQLIFPEIDYDKIDTVRGMDITIVTTARTDDEGRALLAAFGFPFRREAL